MKALILGAALVAATLVPAAGASADPFDRGRVWTTPRGPIHAYHERQAQRHPASSYRPAAHARRHVAPPPRLGGRAVRHFERDGDHYRVVRTVHGRDDDGQVTRRVYRNGEPHKVVRNSYRDGELRRQVTSTFRSGEPHRTVKKVYRDGEPVRVVRTRHGDGGNRVTVRERDRTIARDRRAERLAQRGPAGRRGGANPRF